MIGRLAALAATLPFDLGRPPLLRVWLLALTGGEHICLLTMHHIVSDGWSMNILLREALTVYAALDRGEAPCLPPLTVQYPDFALWQRAWLQGEVLEREASYWRERLAGAPPVLELPAERARPVVPSGRGGACKRRISSELVGGIHELCRCERCTPFMALLAGFYAVLGGLTGRSDLVVGTDSAGRNRLETEGLIGFFVNQLVLRVDLSGDPTLAELLARVRATVLAAFAHEDLPFNHLVAALNPPRSPSHSPVFQVKLVLQSFTPPAPERSPLALKFLPPSHVPAQLDLLLELIPEGDELVVTAKYVQDLFSAQTIECWLSCFEQVLGILVHEPHRPLASVLAELAETERRLQRKQEQILEAASLQRLQYARRRAAEPLQGRI